jgi:hypothetical protein
MTMKTITYGRLDQVLCSHGFTYRMIDRARVYKHPTGALFAIAYYPDSDEVLPSHLDTVRITFKTYGLADPLDLASQLQTAS